MQFTEEQKTRLHQFDKEANFLTDEQRESLRKFGALEECLLELRDINYLHTEYLGQRLTNEEVQEIYEWHNRD
jgi:hypothetical protein